MQKHVATPKTAKLPSAEKQAVGWSVPQHMPNLKYAHDSWWDIKCQSSVALSQRVKKNHPIKHTTHHKAVGVWQFWPPVFRVWAVKS